MSLVFKKIALIGRQTTKEAAKTLTAIIQYLQHKKIKVCVEHDTATILPNCEIPAIHRDNLKKHSDLIIAVGGDGSFLNAACVAAKLNLPIIGVNRGKLGFLTDIAPNNLDKILDILAGKYTLESRFLLTTESKCQEQILNTSLALNDIVLLAATPGTMIKFGIFVDNQFLCAYSADGLIVATPTGSTAHALSGGGPILHPALEAIVLLPMLSHNLSSRPIVINNASKIKVCFGKSNSSTLLVKCDGIAHTILQGDYLTITKAKENLQLLHPCDYNYYETLRTKLHWETK